MTWVDRDGEVRPQSWEEYCMMVKRAPDWSSTQALMQRGFTETEIFTRVQEPQTRTQSQMKAERLLRMRPRLFHADSHCFWCGIETVLDSKHERQANFATIDHLYSRFHPERRRRHMEGKGVLHVLACAQCNQERAGAENQCQPFTPKIPERRQFAESADATLANRQAKPAPSPAVRAARSGLLPPMKEAHPAVVLSLKEEHQREIVRGIAMRTICTIKEAIEYARENPSR